MDFSIVTPCFNGRRFLPLAAASVADQEGASVEHIVADGGSTDGTVDWLRAAPGLRWFSGPDRGMYDAINKGMALATGDILGYLNCDEQYLPGALAAVAAVFRARPGADLVYGDMMVVDPKGALLAFRKSYPLRWPYVAAAHLYVPSCALFWRRRLPESGLVFDPRWRAQGDADFVVRALRAGFRPARLRRYLAAFTLSGSNLGNSPAAEAERRAALREAPAWVRALRPAWGAVRLVEKALAGAYRQAFPLSYALYTPASPDRRTVFTPASGSPGWPSR